MKNKEVIFLQNVSGINDLILNLNRLNTNYNESGETVVMLNEFDLNVQDVIACNQKIKAVAKDKGISLIMAPLFDDIEIKILTCPQKDLPIYKMPIAGPTLLSVEKLNKSFDENTIVTTEISNKISWSLLSKELSKKEIIPEIIIEEIDNERVDSIGFFFSSEGLAYAFPKMWEKKPIHKIPNTHIGISICGEINSLTQGHLKDIEVVYNPSREKDDIYMGLRMKALFNPNITKDDVKEWLIENRYKNFFSEHITKKENSQLDEEVDLLHKNIKRKAQNSMYAKNLNDKTPIIRADGYCSGVLNPGENTKILYIDNSDSRMKRLLLSYNTFLDNAKKNLSSGNSNFLLKFCAYFCSGLSIAGTIIIALTLISKINSNLALASKITPKMKRLPFLGLISSGTALATFFAKKSFTILNNQEHEMRASEVPRCRIE